MPVVDRCSRLLATREGHPPYVCIPHPSQQAAAPVAVASTAALTTPRRLHRGPRRTAGSWPTDYAFTAFAYGTKVKAAAGELRSADGPRAGSAAPPGGQDQANEVLGVDAPNNNPLIHLGAITSRSTTYKRMKQGIAAGTQSTSTVASVVLGPAEPAGRRRS